MKKKSFRFIEKLNKPTRSDKLFGLKIMENRFESYQNNHS